MTLIERPLWNMTMPLPDTHTDPGKHERGIDRSGREPDTVFTGVAQAAFQRHFLIIGVK